MDVSEYLDQSDVWVATDGKKVAIQDMTPDHAAHAARWLAQSATGLILIVEAKINEDAYNGDCDVADVLALVAQTPKDWIMRKPLFRALMRVASRR